MSTAATSSTSSTAAISSVASLPTKEDSSGTELLKIPPYATATTGRCLGCMFGTCQGHSEEKKEPTDIKLGGLGESQLFQLVPYESVCPLHLARLELNDLKLPGMVRLLHQTTDAKTKATTLYMEKIQGKTAEDHITKRALSDNQICFNEQVIVGWGWRLTAVLAGMQKCKLDRCSMNGHNIVVVDQKDQAQVKIHIFQPTTMEEKKDGGLAPELLDGSAMPNIASAIWSLGCLLLRAMLLEARDCFSFAKEMSKTYTKSDETEKIRVDLAKLVDSCKHTYSKELCNLVKQHLAYHPTNRITPDEALKAWMALKRCP